MLVLFAAAFVARPLILTHYMPWFESRPISGHWGWHWTMNHFDPDQIESNGTRSVASHFRPLIGPYDSSDPDLLQCHVLEMKLAGIDGVLIDWYGTVPFNDYALINRNTSKMIAACGVAGLKFGIVLEDQVVPQLEKAGKANGAQYATSALSWMRDRWFKLPGYIQCKQHPVLLMFGPQYYKDAEVNALFGGLSLFTLLDRRANAVGGFGWPEPQVGDARSWQQLDLFQTRSRSWDATIPVAYPRFDDIYKEAGIGPGYGHIRDDDGRTFTRTFAAAVHSGAFATQVATWNDWGEGTQIEPSVEMGYRDLEVIQRTRRESDKGFRFVAADLLLPVRLYKLRKQNAPKKELDRAARLLNKGDVKAAKLLLDHASLQTVKP